jgi:hypothetical protein
MSLQSGHQKYRYLPSLDSTEFYWVFSLTNNTLANNKSVLTLVIYNFVYAARCAEVQVIHLTYVRITPSPTFCIYINYNILNIIVLNDKVHYKKFLINFIRYICPSILTNYFNDHR